MTLSLAFILTVALVVLYSLHRTVLKTPVKWRLTTARPLSPFRWSAKQRIASQNGTSLQDDWLTAAVDKLSYKLMVPSSILMEDLYFIPNYNFNLKYTHRIIRQPRATSCSELTELVILVPSEPGAISVRKAVRETWGSVGKGKTSWPWRRFTMKVCLVFVLGVPVLNETSTQNVNSDNSVHKFNTVTKVDFNRLINLTSEFQNKQSVEEFIERAEYSSKQTTQKDRSKHINHVIKPTAPVRETSVKHSKFSKRSLGKRDISSNFVQRNSIRTQLIRTYNDEPVFLESEKYNDILQFDMVDSYHNLTRKLLVAMDWVLNHFPKAKYMLKADQDVFVNVPLLTTFLKKYGEKNSIYGHLYANSYVCRSGKWAVDKSVVPIPKYPVYTAGNAYVMSLDAVLKISQMSGHFPYVPMEDAFLTGILASVAGVNRFHVAGFTYWLENTPSTCQFVNDKRYIGNKYTPHTLRQVWRTLTEQGGDRCDS